MSADLGTTNMWLAILVVLALVQLAGMTAAFVMAARLYERTTRALRDLETAHLAPLVTDLHVALRDIHELVSRVGRADDQVRLGVQRVERAIDRTASTLRERVLPVLAIAHGVRAAVAAFRSRLPRARVPGSGGPQLIDEARLVSEGGHEPAEAAFRM